ncbi:LTA synthase family protein [Ectobacillus panaciterrae]|uniref:LTA synthase family protein n=1 Tax=Ectobacillus panaciterrae TaxID=363872 RepID=UPI0003FC8A39|nr:LTA synthase family protein [Ectobacillus panaciterrae]
MENRPGINYTTLFLAIVILKIMLVRFVIFHKVEIYHTFIAEIGFVLIVGVLIESLPRIMRKIGVLTANFMFSLILFSTLIYNDFYGTIPTYQSLAHVGQLGAIFETIKAFFNPIYFTLFLDIFVLIIMMVMNKELFMPKFKMKRLYQYTLLMCSLLLIFGNTYIVHSEDIKNEKVLVEKMGISNYQLYSAIKTHTKETVEVSSFTNEKVNGIKGLDKAYPKKWLGIAKNKNLIILQLESFENALVGLKIDGIEITPNLNKLAKENLYFPNFYQQVGIGNTSDAEFAVNTSLYPFGPNAMADTFGNRDIPSLPKLLSKFGYRSATFHTNDITFWNRDEMYPMALGFEKAYDKKFFGDKDPIAFGSNDEILYAKTLEELSKYQKEGKRFYAQLISMSSHSPFIIPVEKQKLRIGRKYDGTMFGDYVKAAHYADFALGQFISGLKEKGLWDTSLFVIYGDHSGVQSTKEIDMKLMKEAFGRERLPHEKFNVPLVIVSPWNKEGQIIDIVGSQVDIFPTVANLLGVSADGQTYMGQDLVNSKSNTVGIRFYLPTGSFINNDVVFIPGTKFEDGTAYSLKTKRKVQHSLYKAEYDKVINLYDLSDKYVETIPLSKK